MDYIAPFLTLIVLCGAIVNASNGNEGAFFTSIQLFNTLSGTYNCTDPNQLFVLSASLYVPAGKDEPIYLKVPDSFGNLPNGSFPLKSNSDVIGTITNMGSNNFSLSFNDVIAQNTSATFNFLTKLTAVAQKNISEPQLLDYTFDVSSGSSFTSSINFIPKDINKLSSNGGIFAENNTAWFVADLPLNALTQASRFSSIPAIKSSYSFNTSLTTYEIVVKVDALNRPLASVPFTALQDQSDSSQISIYINTKVDGGKYLRIKYYSEQLTSPSIANTISLQATNSENTRLARRDTTSQTLTSNYYSGNETNIDDSNGSDTQDTQSSSINALYSNVTSTQTESETYQTYSILSVTGSAYVSEIGTWVPISTLTNTSSTLATSTGASSSFTRSIETDPYSTAANSTSQNSQTKASSSAGNSTEAAQLTSTISSAFSSSTPMQNTNASASILHTTSSIISSSLFEITNSSSSLTSNSPVSTSSMSSGSSTTSSSFTGYNESDSYITYSVISLTSDGQLTSFTSWFAVATQSSSISARPSALTTTSDSSDSMSDLSMTVSLQSASSTIDDSDYFQTYTLITRTQNGQEVVSTSWFPIRTISGTSSVTPPTSSGRIASPTQAISSIDDSFLTYSIVTKTVDGTEAISTSWFPIRTISGTSSVTPPTSSSGRIASPTQAISSIDDSFLTYSIVTKTVDGTEAISTSWFPIDTVSTSKGSLSRETSSQESYYVTYSVTTGTFSGGETASTSWFPQSSIDMMTMKASSSDYQAYSIVTKTRSGQAVISTSWAAVSTELSYATAIPQSSYTPSSETESSILTSQQVTSSISAQTLLPQVSSSTASYNTSQTSLMIYQDEAKRASISMGGVLAGILLFLF